MKVIDFLKNVLFNTSRKSFVFIISAILLMRVGVSFMPNIDTLASIAMDPFKNNLTHPMAHYLFYSWLSSFTTWVIHATSPRAYFIFHAMCALVFYVLFAKTVFERLSEDNARISMMLFSLLPVSGTIIYWIGIDALTLLLMMVALAYPRYSFFTLLCGMLLGMQHFEQSILASCALLFAVVLTNTLFRVKASSAYSIKFCIMLLSGVILGKLLLTSIFTFYDIQLSTDRLSYAQVQGKIFIKNFILNFHIIMWSVLGIGWLMVLKYAEKGRETIPFLFTLASLILVSAFVDDETRVVALITFPLLCVFWLFNENALKMVSRQEATVCFLIGALVPWAWVWQGVSRPSVFVFDVVYVVKKLIVSLAV